MFNIEDTTQPPTVCPAALAGVLDFTEEGMWVGSLDGAVVRAPCTMIHNTHTH